MAYILSRGRWVKPLFLLFSAPEPVKTSPDVPSPPVKRRRGRQPGFRPSLMKKKALQESPAKPKASSPETPKVPRRRPGRPPGSLNKPKPPPMEISEATDDDGSPRPIKRRGWPKGVPRGSPNKTVLPKARPGRPPKVRIWGVIL